MLRHLQFRLQLQLLLLLQSKVLSQNLPACSLGYHLQELNAPSQPFILDLPFFYPFLYLLSQLLTSLRPILEHYKRLRELPGVIIWNSNNRSILNKLITEQQSLQLCWWDLESFDLNTQRDREMEGTLMSSLILSTIQ